MFVENTDIIFQEKLCKQILIAKENIKLVTQNNHKTGYTVIIIIIIPIQQKHLFAYTKHVESNTDFVELYITPTYVQPEYVIGTWRQCLVHLLVRYYPEWLPFKNIQLKSNHQSSSWAKNKPWRCTLL